MITPMIDHPDLRLTLAITLRAAMSSALNLR
jgi:hypothetical protein